MNQKLKTSQWGRSQALQSNRNRGKSFVIIRFARHILTSKSAKRKRKLGKSIVITDADTPAVRKMLPYAEDERSSQCLEINVEQNARPPVKGSPALSQRGWPISRRAS